MFGIFKKKKEQQFFNRNYIGLHTDMHSHLLPGIDDGSPDLDTSVELIRGMMDAGYKKFITTPHVYPDLFPNTNETILQAHAALTNRLQQENINVELNAAAEYFIDDQFAERLTNNEKLLTLHKNWVLFEISFLSPPPDLNEVIFQMITCGYQPVLAHPERYNYYHQQKEAYHRFKDQGCLLQINLLSLAGYYGKSVQDAARMLVKDQLVDLIGSDLHHTRHLQAMQNNLLMAEVDAILSSGRILNSTL